ncbi:MAG: hypothetical protein QUS11_09480 [Candidatus Fermentibacter sp.]|nr:hypothetical protein [Candidatus Fermentibacter sp.]
MDALDLKEIENRAYAIRSESGLLDVVIGAGLLGYGLLASMGAYLVPTFCLLLALLLRKFVVTPRVGSVRFSEDRRTRERRGVMLIALIVLLPVPLGLAVFFTHRTETWTGLLSTHPILLLGLAVALGMTAVAWAKSAGRFYVFAIMAVLNFAGAQLAGQPHTWPVMATGAPILTVGVVLMARFMRRNPVQREEAA